VREYAMRRMLTVAAGVALVVSAAGMQAQGDAQATSADEWGKLVAANNLDIKGNSPFDLAMTFQTYGMDGTPAETGTVEEWWGAPGSRRVEVHMAGLNEDGSAPEGAAPALVRDAYLVRQLLDAAVNPVPPAPMASRVLATRNGEPVADTKMTGTQAIGELTTESVKFGKVKLDCTAPKLSSKEMDMNAILATMCVEPQTMDVLILEGLGGRETVVRAATGKFRDTFVALNLCVVYLGRDAITGKLTTMKTLDPATLAVKLPEALAPKVSGPENARVAGGVIAGNRISFVEPEYPEMAKMQHLSGSVLLGAVIGKDGAIRSLVPLASTDRMFTNSATEAVRRWKYRPYLLNGEPTEVDTTITVNFALSGG
jgi:TonB family protein